MAEHSRDDLGPNDWYIAYMGEQFIADPSSVDESWRQYFQANPPTPSERGTPPPAPTPSADVEPTTERAFSAEDNNPGVPVPVVQEVGGANLEIVTRSDLPPAPPTRVQEATSPYTRSKAVELAARRDGRQQENVLEPIRGIGRSIVKNMEQIGRAHV